MNDGLISAVQRLEVKWCSGTSVCIPRHKSERSNPSKREWNEQEKDTREAGRAGQSKTAVISTRDTLYSQREGGQCDNYDLHHVNYGYVKLRTALSQTRTRELRSKPTNSTPAASVKLFDLGGIALNPKQKEQHPAYKGGT